MGHQPRAVRPVLLVPLLNNGYMPDRSDIREGDRFGESYSLASIADKDC